MLDYAVGFVVMAGIYSVLSLGLNVQWGFTGLFNIGIAGFFALGAYTAALLTGPPPQGAYEDFIFGGDWAQTAGLSLGLDLWFFLGIAAAMLTCSAVALVIGYVTLRLNDDYLAIATLGIAESVRLFFLNEKWAANGSRGLYNIPKFLEEWIAPDKYDYLYVVVVLIILAVLFLAMQQAAKSPWGRVLRAIREDELAAAAQRQKRSQIQAASLHPRRGNNGHWRRPIRPQHPFPVAPNLRPITGNLHHLGHADGRRIRQQRRRHPGRLHSMGHLDRHPIYARHIQRPQLPLPDDRNPNNSRHATTPRRPTTRTPPPNPPPPPRRGSDRGTRR